MGYGLAINNNDNRVLVDNNYSGYLVDSVTTVTSSTANYGYLYPYSAAILPSSFFHYDGTILAFRKQSDPDNIINVSELVATGVVTQFDGYGTAMLTTPYPVNTLFQVAKLRRTDIVNPSSSSGVGLVTYTSNGSVSFTSTEQLFKISHVFDISLTPGTADGATFVFNYPALTVSKPLYFFVNGITGFTVSSSLYYFFGVAAISMGSTSCTLTVSRTSYTNLGTAFSDLTSGRVSVAVGYIV